MSNTINLKKYEKKRIIENAIELYFPNQTEQNFQEDIKKQWNQYVKSIAPNVSEDHFSVGTANFYYDGEYLFSIPNTFWINLSFISLESYSSAFNVDMNRMPSTSIQIIFELYQDFLEKKDRFRSLFETKMLEVSTLDQFHKKLPHLKHLVSFLSDSNSDLAVAIDVDQISKDTVIAV